MRLAVSAPTAALVTAGASAFSDTRPFFSIPTLAEVRDDLAQLEGPLIRTLIRRLLLPIDPCLYNNGGASALHTFLARQEQTEQARGRYDYGTVEYPYTLPPVAPDVASASDPFPPGRFHQDTFTGNAKITAFYTGTLVPLFNQNTSFFYRLSDNSTSSSTNPEDNDAVLSVDVALLQLLSNRVHIGKVVAEAKYAANVSSFTPAIESHDASALLTLLTNSARAAEVLVQVDTAASELSVAWTSAGELVPPDFADRVRDAVQRMFSELIDMTTQIEVEYLLERL